MLCHFVHVPRWVYTRWVGAGGCSTMIAGAGRQACPWTVWMIPHHAGVVREVKQSPRLSCEAGGLAWQICKWVVFRRFAALDVRSDYSVEYFFVPGGSRNVAGNPDSPQVVIFSTSFADVLLVS